MNDRHTIAHAALSAVYCLTGSVLTLEHAFAHALCAFAAAVIYAFLCRHAPEHRPSDPDRAPPTDAAL